MKRHQTLLHDCDSRERESLQSHENSLFLYVFVPDGSWVSSILIEFFYICILSCVGIKLNSLES